MGKKWPDKTGARNKKRNKGKEWLSQESEWGRTQGGGVQENRLFHRGGEAGTPKGPTPKKKKNGIQKKWKMGDNCNRGKGKNGK